MASLLWGAAPSHGEIARTRHNLSATGPGEFKTGETQELCVFCHTPHSASSSRALWNRDLSPATYTLYTSSTLEGSPQQPTGTSRLCLSCHDGLTALGGVRVAPEGGLTGPGPLTGRAALGTDLSDDHPISFVYDSALAARRKGLADPANLPQGLPLDRNAQVQCTTCHEPHQNPYRKFLRMDDRGGALCLSCHTPANWSGASHATSPATWSGVGINPWPASSPYTTVRDHACLNCHRPHAASRAPRLLSQTQERTMCLVCHTGNVASKNLEPEFLKASAHPVGATNWTHDPREDPYTMSRHAACQDCHNPHQVNASPGVAPAVSGRLQGVRGVTIGGTLVETASFTYEVCLKCHGIRDQLTPSLVRQDNTRNIRLEIDPSNPSYHPVAAIGKYPGISGLQSGYSATSRITCTDCHGNDAAAAGGPQGPHGSQFAPILVRQLQQTDPSPESPQNYALCYSCHSRSSLLNTRFPHDKHLFDAQAPCVACHDPHGSRQNIRLINFMLRDRTGKTVVGPNQKGLIQFVPEEPGRGNCSLNCHGKEHDRRNY